MSLPPANSDPKIQLIRSITNSIYPLLFNSFQTISNLTSTYNKIAAHSLDKNLKDDIAWAKESVDKDIEKLNALQKHLQFLNAKETLTTPSELLKVFNEITDFAQLILLDDLITTLKGVASVSDELVIDGIGLKEAVVKLQKFNISLKLTADPIKKLKGDELSVDELEKAEETVDRRILDLEQRILELKSIVH